jgi:hypothetical protein
MPMPTIFVRTIKELGLVHHAVCNESYYMALGTITNAMGRMKNLLGERWE